VGEENVGSEGGVPPKQQPIDTACAGCEKQSLKGSSWRRRLLEGRGADVIAQAGITLKSPIPTVLAPTKSPLPHLPPPQEPVRVGAGEDDEL